MTSSRDHLSKTDNFRRAAIQTDVPVLEEARGLIDGFHATMRKGQAKYARNPQPSLAAQFDLLAA